MREPFSRFGTVAGHSICHGAWNIAIFIPKRFATVLLAEGVFAMKGKELVRREAAYECVGTALHLVPMDSLTHPCSHKHDPIGFACDGARA